MIQPFTIEYYTILIAIGNERHIQGEYFLNLEIAYTLLNIISKCVNKNSLKKLITFKNYLYALSYHFGMRGRRQTTVNIAVLKVMSSLAPSQMCFI